MAIDPKTKYVGRIDTSDLIGYPLGKCRNESAPSANDGTPSDSDWMNDSWGLFQSLLDEAGIAPSGSPDKVGASQYLTALQTLFAGIADGRFPTTGQKAAMDAAASPGAGNAFATANELAYLPSADQKAALEGTDGTPSVANKYVTNSDSRLIGDAAFSYDNMLHISDQQADNLSGGSITAGIWTPRPLRVVHHNTISGASLAADPINQITLPVGTYWWEAMAQGYHIDFNVIKVREVSPGAADHITGLRSYTSSGHVTPTNWTMLHGKMVLGVTTVFELQQICTLSRSDGMGPNSTLGGAPSIFCDTKIWKVG